MERVNWLSAGSEWLTPLYTMVGGTEFQTEFLPLRTEMAIISSRGDIIGLQRFTRWVILCCLTFTYIQSWAGDFWNGQKQQEGLFVRNAREF